MEIIGVLKSLKFPAHNCRTWKILNTDRVHFIKLYLPQLFSVDRPRLVPFLQAPLPRRMRTLDSGLDFLPFLHTQTYTDLTLSAVQKSWCCEIYDDCVELWSAPAATEDVATFPLLSVGMPHWYLKNTKLVYFNNGI